MCAEMRFREEPEERVSGLSRITPAQILHSGNDVFERMSVVMKRDGEGAYMARNSGERANSDLQRIENAQNALATREGGKKQFAESFIAFLDPLVSRQR